ncbi:MAG: hypothetical protein PHH06_00940 [Candidatus Gracilibacteria bacterium]|nr:hypothetical protein [Candidatus Gracilibacteria bacterium]
MNEDVLYEKFIRAIDNKLLIKIAYFNKFGKLLTKICVPYDFGIMHSYRDLQNRYFFYNYKHIEKNTILHIKASNMYFIELLEETFCPISLGINNKSFILLRNW